MPLLPVQLSSVRCRRLLLLGVLWRLCRMNVSGKAEVASLVAQSKLLCCLLPVYGKINSGARFLQDFYTKCFLLVRSGFDMFRQLSSETKKNDLNYEIRDAFPYLTDSSILHFWSTSSAFHFFAFVQNSKCCFTLHFRLCFLLHFLSLRLLSPKKWVNFRCHRLFFSFFSDSI